MSKTVLISDDVAALLEKQRKLDGLPSLDAAAEAYIIHGLLADGPEDDHSDGRSVDELRALIQEAYDSGPAEPWDAEEMKAEVRRRYAERKQEGR